MNKEQRQVIEEVIESIEIHQAVIHNAIEHKARIGTATYRQETLKDMADGMEISLSKLEGLIIS